MSDLAVTNTYIALTTIVAAQLNTNFSDIVSYINNRDDGTATWDNANVTATVANPVTIKSNQSTTEVAIDNTATDGDPFICWKLSGTRQFSLGVNDGASDVLQLGTTAIDSSTMFQATSAGEITQPLQPSFLVTNSAGQVDITGDGTVVTVTWGNEVRDAGGDFASNTFTAPVTGQYFLQASVLLSGITSGHTGVGYLAIVTGNRTYLCRRTSNSYVESASAGFLQLFGNVMADMDAGDTAIVQVSVSGSTKVVDVLNDAQYNYFSGSLIN